MVHMCRRFSGFTLLEVLVALVVIGTGITVLISLFSSSLGLSQSSRNECVAASLAEEQMQSLLKKPGGYEWPVENVAPGELAKVNVRGKSADDNAVDPPSVLPVERAAHEREAKLYDQFSWSAFAKLPAADAPYVEVTVTVNWVESGRDRVFSLTSGIPRALIQGVATSVRAEGSA